MSDGSATAHLYRPKLATVLSEGYNFSSFRRDMIVALSVATVAVLLSMAIAVASGDSPERGLYAAVIGGFLVSALGGSRSRWTPPPNANWDYTAFGGGDAAAAPDESINLKFVKIPGGRGGYNRWTINGKSWPDTNPLFNVQRGKRYRMILDNNSGDEHPVHLHRHSFEITKIGEKTTSGVIKDTISMPRYSKAEVDFVADDPGDTFFHCHHQDHMDEGFAGLITYV
jgi:FtsP/CotA-like multicopper oxidase with cupredoxin domain